MSGGRIVRNPRWSRTSLHMALADDLPVVHSASVRVVRWALWANSGL
jgi:hypothetical protein